VGALLFALAPSGIGRAAEPTPATRGVILIISDSLRADHLSAYGYSRKTSPNLKALGEAGVLFERAYAQAPWTNPSIASIFTSLNPSVHRSGHSKSRFGYRSSIPGHLRTLAAVMRENGFRTKALANSPTISGRLGYGRGFESYLNREKIPPDRPTQSTSEFAIALLKDMKDENFLLFWHLIDPHWPYYPPPEHRVFVDPAYRGRFAKGATTRQVTRIVRDQMAPSERERQQLIDLYDGEVHFVDAQVGELLAAVEALGLASRVSVVFTSDHGESFGEYGHYGHSVQMYQENLRIPLIVRDARFEPRRVRAVVQAIDIMPTILELAGIPANGDGQGRSLVPLLRGTSGAWSQRPAFSESPQFTERKAINTEKFELIFGPSGRVLNDRYEAQTRLKKYARAPIYKLYGHGSSSPTPEVAADHPEVARRLAQAIEERMQENERLQTITETGFYTFYFLGEDWRKRAHTVTGDAKVEGGALTLGKGAEVTWRLGLPRPADSISLGVVARCAKPRSFFLVYASAEPGSWTALHTTRFPGKPVREAEFATPKGTASSEFFVRFTESGVGGCRLRGFHVEAKFGGAPPELDDETRRNLEALGYIDGK
jgi:arylsulfatase